MGIITICAATGHVPSTTALCVMFVSIYLIEHIKNPLPKNVKLVCKE